MGGLAFFFSLLAGCGAGKPDDAAPADADADVDADTDSDEDLDQVCLEDPTAAGCPCDTAEPFVCYTGPDGTLGVGVCVAGLRSCERGTWSDCEGAVLPDLETCNAIDDNCDGSVDEGVTNECGTCGECSEHCVGIDCGDAFSPDAGNSSDVFVDDDGALALMDGGTSGEYRHLEDGLGDCGACVGWESLSWESETPAGTEIRIELRSAESLDALESQPWAPLAVDPPDASPVRLPFDDYGPWYIELRFELRSDSELVTPRLLRFSVEWSCSLVIC